jgi:hypothetical protein
MLHERIHSNGFERVHRESTQNDWWSIAAVTHGPQRRALNVLELKASTLERAEIREASLWLAIGVTMNATAGNNSLYHSVAGKAHAMSKL